MGVTGQQPRCPSGKGNQMEGGGGGRRRERKDRESDEDVFVTLHGWLVYSQGTLRWQGHTHWTLLGRERQLDCC